MSQFKLSPKVLVIPRNRWLRLNMTEKLFTGTLNHNQNKTKQFKLWQCLYSTAMFCGLMSSYILNCVEYICTLCTLFLYT